MARPGLARPSGKEATLIIAFVALVAIAVLPGLREGFSIIPPYNWIVWGTVAILIAAAVAWRDVPLRLAVLSPSHYTGYGVFGPGTWDFRVSVPIDGRSRAFTVSRVLS